MLPESPSTLAPPLPSILERILRRRRERVVEAQRRMSIQRVHVELADLRRQPRDFVGALRQARRPAIIAELKRASPSRGMLRQDFDVPKLAAAYERAGATALSVLTEEDHFQGELEYLMQARNATRLPILRKDFIFCVYQLWEAALAGADAVLLIAAMLDDKSLKHLLVTAREAGLQTLCEVHDRGELERAVKAGATCIGVNNRDLHSFTVDLAHGEELGPLLPPGVVGVAESGLRSGADLARMSEAGFQAFLIGEPFMEQSDPGHALAQLLGSCHPPFVKICGITSPEDARLTAEAGAHAIGLVFSPSPRQVSIGLARAVVPVVPTNVLRVGVFADMPASKVGMVAGACGLHAAQLHDAYTVEEGRRLAAAGLPIWRAVGMPRGAKAALAWAPFVERFVLDTAVGGRSGGTGTTFPWEAAREFIAELARLHPRRPEVLIAGGLTPDNVAAALRRSGADGVDVSSGVEAEPGRKSPDQLARFCQNARAAFRGDPL